MKVSRRRLGRVRLAGKRLHHQIEKRKTRSRRVAELEIPLVEDLRERCVLLLGCEAGEDEVKLIAWHPEKGEAALVSAEQLLLPPLYRPVDSCGGFICAVHSDCIGELSDWKFRVAVSNPASNYQVELPVLDLTRLPTSPERDFSTGRLRVRMTPPLHEGELFCVHVTTSDDNGENRVHSFNTSSWRWESSAGFSGEAIGRHLVGDLLFRHRNVRSYDVARRKWTAISGPGDGQRWDGDLPVPERFAGSSYRTVTAFRYGKKIMAAGALWDYRVVLLERDGEGWRVVAIADEGDFPSCASFMGCMCGLEVDWPVVRGDLLVLPCFSRPVAFNLRNQMWMEVPPVLAESSLFLYPACVYEPRQQI